MKAAAIRRRFNTTARPPGVRQGLDPRRRGDHDLNPWMAAAPPYKPAAVLVPVIDRPSGATILLTKRTDHLPDHPGQISFPGGSIEAADANAEAAALREAEEEVGLPRAAVEIVGRLDDYVVRTGFLVSPFVGIIKPPLELRPDPVEVAEVFEIPLDFILDTANHERHSRDFQGRESQFYVLPYEDRYIWGATAGMLINLYEVLVAS